MRQILVLLLVVAATLAVPVDENPETNFLRLQELITKLDNPIIQRADNDKYRLPTNVIPSAYTVELTLPKNWETGKKFTGVSTIKIKATETNIKTIVLHQAELLEIKKIKLGNDDIAYDNTKFDRDAETYTITLTNALSTTDDSILSFEFNGVLYEDMYGFYISTYTDQTKVKHTIATTQFQATYARRAFPCFDEPQFKATFEVTLKYPKTYKSLSNQPGTLQPETGEEAINKFGVTAKMSTYLVAFIVHDFDKKTVTEGEDPNKHEYNLWAPTELVDTAEYASTVTPNLLKVLNEFTKIDYWKNGMNQLDQVAIPDFSAGAMENWGLVTYRETALLWNKDESTYRNKQRVASVIAHEFAHMWFGNLVTMKWWESTWLNEGFATYFESYVTGEVEKDFEMMKQFVLEDQQSIFTQDANTKALALTSPAFTPFEVQAKFGSITYSKGGSIVRMMEHIVGLKEFKTNLNLYLTAFKSGNTEPINLFDKFKPIETIAFKDIMNEWITVSGYPVVTVQLTNESKIQITQERFLYSKNDVEENPTKWHIPISYTTGIEKNFDVTTPKKWLLKTETSKNIEEDFGSSWIILNLQQSAYYRVNYDNELWDRLVRAISNNEILDINKAQIVDDVLNLARAEKMGYIQAFDLISFLESETDYYPWYSAFESFNFLRKRLSSRERELLGDFITKIMTNLYNSVSWDITPETKQIDMLKKVLAFKWACELDHEECVSKSREMFDKIDETPINPNLRSIVYCSALRHGNKTHWDKLWTRFETTKIATEQVTILGALGCTKNVDILNDYLLRSLDNNKIRKQDAYSAFTSVLIGNPEGVPVAFKFLVGNYDQIVISYGSMNALSNVINNVADRLTSANQLLEFGEFIENHQNNLGEAKAVAIAALKTATGNIQWVMDNSGELREFFIGYFNVITTTGSANGVFASMFVLLAAFIWSRLL